jgi:hypothetical protein
MKRNIFLFSQLLAFMLVMGSCKKALETTPLNSLDLPSTLKTKEGLNATLTSIYNTYQGSAYYGRDIIVIPELLADNGEITSNNTNRFLNQANNAPSSHINIWATLYGVINRTNLIINNVDASSASAAEKQQWKGEALFLRGLSLFDATRIFARNPLNLNVTGAAGATSFDLGVPILKDGVADATQVTYPTRPKVGANYDAIVEDLVAANNLLSNTTQVYRARKVAAQALLSRVELYRGNWAASERWADSVLLGTAAQFAPASTYFTTWGKGHPETIFGLQYQTGEPNPGGEGLQYIYYRNLPAINGYADVTATASLRADMGTADLRYQRLISAQVKSGQNVFFCMKWPLTGQLGQDDIMILRTSEVVLNRAEARARQGKDALATADLNQTRVRAGLTAIPTSGAGSLTGILLINEILKERRIELAFEGHRLWDLLRTNRDIVKPSGTTLLTTDFKLICNIPIAETDVNKNVVQNPGY